MARSRGVCARSAERLSVSLAPGRPRIFRPGRDSDSAYQGLGIPFFSIGVPGPGDGDADVDAAGRIAYWHAPDDTFDKLDMKALERDTQYRVAQLYDLATVRVLPHRLAPIAAAYAAALKELAGAATGLFDLSTTVKAATALQDAADRFDRAPRPDNPAGINAFNRLVVRLTHQLNSALYSRTGRFDQDPAAEEAVLPLLARIKDLPSARGERVRARNALPGDKHQICAAEATDAIAATFDEAAESQSGR
jgi:hypothetical protein